MKMIYENEFGTVDMFGEGGADLCILEVDGAEILGRERTLVKFPEKDGYEENTASFAQRVLTVSGDTSETGKLQNALRVFSKPGTLTIETESTKRQITVNDTVFKTTQKNGKYKGFCLQMTCDKPHFTDCADISREVYSRKNLITAETTLPAMFTKRTFGGNIRNDGECRIEPIFVIKGVGDAPENGTLRLENKTTQKKIILNHSVQKDEVITVDIPNRKVTSSVAGDILCSLDIGSYLYDIYLECGDNDIDAAVSEENGDCEIYVSYRNLYTGMVI